MIDALDLSENRFIIIYIDTGANIKFLKIYYDFCKFIAFPYDSNHRRKVSPRPLVATPSAAPWQDCHISWPEAKFPWSEFKGSKIYNELEQIVGKSNRQDILHLDSANKEQADIFLTSDKDDIWNHRQEIEKITSYKIFHTGSEEESIISYIKKLMQRNRIKSFAHCES